MKTAKKEHFKLLDKEWGSLVNPHTGLVYDNMVEEVNCPVCNSVRYNKIFSKKGLNFVKCLSCSHVFINPQPKQEILDRHFEGSAAWGVWSKKVLVAKGQLQFDKRKYNRAIAEICDLSSRKKNLKLLDVGCSSGIFLNLARKKGWDVYGIELSFTSVEFAKKHFKLEVFHGNFDDFQTNKKFDVITFWASLEYNKNVKGAIAKADKLLKRGGLLLILISGNSHSLVMRILQQKCIGFLFNRVHSFSPQSLDYLLNRFSYKLVLRYSIIPEIDVILNYLDYEDPYGPRSRCKLFSNAEKEILRSIIDKNNMGYKFISIYRKKEKYD